mmetsp:Transcript_8391/g.17802  ORF Transcript_8391/g.17802 Transcript_8391/m.17802 type:complete len:236 (+) Transcript_8391:259-966(+)
MGASGEREEVLAPIEADELGKAPDRHTAAASCKLQQVLHAILAAFCCPLVHGLPEPSHLLAACGQASGGSCIPLPIIRTDVARAREERLNLAGCQHPPGFGDNSRGHCGAQAFEHGIDGSPQGSAQPPLHKSLDEAVLVRFCHSEVLAVGNQGNLCPSEGPQSQRLCYLLFAHQSVQGGDHLGQGRKSWGGLHLRRCLLGHGLARGGSGGDLSRSAGLPAAIHQDIGERHVVAQA